MNPPDDMDKKVELYTYYMTLGVIALFIVIVLILILQFLVGLLTAISMGGIL